MKSRILLAAFLCTLTGAAVTPLHAGDFKPDPARRAARRERIKALPQEERERLRSAFQASRNDPAFQAAQKSGDRRAMRRARLDAMLKADPGIGPIIQKVRPGAGRRFRNS